MLPTCAGGEGGLGIMQPIARLHPASWPVGKPMGGEREQEGEGALEASPPPLCMYAATDPAAARLLLPSTLMPIIRPAHPNQAPRLHTTFIRLNHMFSSWEMTRRKQWTLRRTIQKQDCKNKIAFLCCILWRKQDLVSQCVNIIQP